MITAALITGIQTQLNKWYDGEGAVEITRVQQLLPVSPRVEPQLAGDFIVDFTCHARRKGESSYLRISHVRYDGVLSLTVPTTVIVGTF